MTKSTTLAATDFEAGQIFVQEQPIPVADPFEGGRSKNTTNTQPPFPSPCSMVVARKKKKSNPQKGRGGGGGGSKSPYHEASDLLNQVLERSRHPRPTDHRSLLKSLVYSPKDGSLRVSTKSYAIVTQALQHLDELRAVQQQCQLLTAAKNEGLLLVLLFELLLSPKQAIRGGGALKRQLIQQEAALRRALRAVTPSPSSLDSSHTNLFPRYLRVNTCAHTTTPSVIQTLQAMDVAVYADAHVPDLLVVPPQATSRILASDDLVGRRPSPPRGVAGQVVVLFRPLSGAGIRQQSARQR